MPGIITAIGNALEPVGKGRLLPDGRVVFAPRRSADSVDWDDDALRYMTPRQRVLLGWAKLPWALVPILFIAFLLQFGLVQRSRKIDFTDSGDVMLFISFIAVWLLVAASFLVIFRIGSRIHKEQFYEPGD